MDMEESLLYDTELSEIRKLLYDRYDEFKSGKVKPIDGREFFESLRTRGKERLRDVRKDDSL